MALHDSLRDLVSVRGAGVFDEAEEFRGALDDFLAEDEASLGELNLLVDAVRLGALRRVLDVLDHGAAPEAAIREAGANLARDRGTDDPTRSCWALATLCFALGKVDEPMVRMFRGDSGTMPAPARPPAPAAPPHAGPGQTHLLQGTSAPAPPPPPPPAPQPVSVQPPSPTVEAHAAPPPQHHGPVPPVIPEERPSRTGTFLLVLLVALILGGLAAGFILLRSDGDDDSTASGGQTSTGADDNQSGGQRDRPLISDDEMLVPYEGDAGSVIYAVDAIHGGYRNALTSGPDDVLPTLSPDRRTMTYLMGPPPLTLMRFDPETASAEPFFTEPGPCAHALRPGWSLDGSRVAVVCTGDDKYGDGIWLADADGNLEDEPIVADSLVRGSPTWVSETEFIFGRQDDESEDAPLTFWRVDVTDGVKVQLDLGLEGLQLTHADYSPEADKVLFLVSAPGGSEIGDIYTMAPDGSNPSQVAAGNYAHPVWSPDGNAIGATIFTTLPTEESGGVEELCYLPLRDDGTAEDPVIVEDPPPGEVGIPVWATR